MGLAADATKASLCLLGCCGDIDFTIGVDYGRSVIRHGVAGLVVFVAHRRLGQADIEAVASRLEEERPQKHHAQGHA